MKLLMGLHKTMINTAFTRSLAGVLFLLLIAPYSKANDDSRELVKLPSMMQEHMLANMRDHLVSINQILIYMNSGELDKAAEIAENRLGMTSLQSHGASHMAQFMPDGMQKVGTAMHRAASRFALKAEEENLSEAYKILTEVTSACVACHSGYKIR